MAVRKLIMPVVQKSLKVILGLIIFGIVLWVLIFTFTMPARHLMPVPQNPTIGTIKTVGDFSFVPLSVSGNPDKYSAIILIVLDNFENNYPEREIMDWQIDRTDSYIHGLWIHHRHRPKQ